MPLTTSTQQHRSGWDGSLQLTSVHHLTPALLRASLRPATSGASPDASTSESIAQAGHERSLRPDSHQANASVSTPLHNLQQQLLRRSSVYRIKAVAAQGMARQRAAEWSSTFKSGTFATPRSAAVPGLPGAT